jgi:type III pantothenate kinase
VELVKPPRVIGKNTVECLQSGVVYGFAGQVDGVVRGITAELGGPVTAVIATGGLAPIVIEECLTVTNHEPMLTLIGLRMIFERNTA